MLNKIIFQMVLLVSVTAATTLLAQTLELNDEYPDEYVVQKGDTLWDISGRFLQEPWFWPEIWAGNQHIENPHLIYPGDIVTLRFTDGVPQLVVNGGEQYNPEQYADSEIVSMQGREVKLSPQIRVLEKERQAIRTIPLQAIEQFLVKSIVVAKDEMQDWPYVVASYDDHLIGSSGNKLYVRGLPENINNRHFSIYRQGEAYRKYSAETSTVGKTLTEDNIIGYESIYVGDAIIEQFGDPASVIVTSTNREVLIGDRLYAHNTDLLSTEFIPKMPDNEIEGRIISVLDGLSQIGQHQVVVLDVGANKGLEHGSILAIYQRGKTIKDRIAPTQKNRPESVLKRNKEKREQERIRFSREDSNPIDGVLSAVFNDVRDAKHFIVDKVTSESKYEEVELPEERIGVLMIIRTFDKISYGLVMEVEKAVHIYDKIRSM